MSYRRPLAAAEKLKKRAAEKLHFMESEYGSADDYVERKTRSEIIEYTLRRIQDKLKSLAEKPDANAEALLADCFNHLCFVMARADLDAEESEVPIPPGHEHP